MRPRLLLVGLCVGALVVVSGCGSAATPPPTVAQATPTPTDPYATLTARQVIETFLNAYQNEQYDTCMALFAPFMGYKAKSSDAFAFDQHHKVEIDGAITRWEYDEYRDHGATVAAFVFIHRTQDSFPAGIQWEVEVSRVNQTWKVSLFT